MEFVLLHVHARPAKGDALHAQAKSLLRAIFSREFDRATRTQYSMPGQAWSLTQNTHHLPRRSGPARGARDGSIA